MKVRLLNDPALRTVCEPINPASYLIEPLLSNMAAAMAEEKGIGLAANQIGIPVRVFIIKKDDSYREFINPEILEKSEEVDFENEGCLSIPGAIASTKRFRVVKLSWLDKGGNKQEEVFEDMMAFAVQHEMDHLNGILYIDQFGPVKKDLVLRKHNKFLRATRR